MLFRRKKPPEIWEKVHISLFPRHSYGRSLNYFKKRILRLNATPHAIAAGLAAGIFVSFTPLLGGHFLLAFVVAYIVAGNMLAAAVGTVIGNPLTFPIIWSVTHRIGSAIIQGRLVEDAAPALTPHKFSYMHLISIWEPVLKPMLIGGTIVGLVVAVPAYFFTRWTIVKYRSSREAKLRKQAIRRRRQSYQTS